MSVIRCPKGHFYDDQRFSSCPHCGISVNAEERSAEGKKKLQSEERRGLRAWLDQSKTVAFLQKAEDSGAERTVALESIQEDAQEKTIGFYAGVKGNDYVTGWLVCTAGAEKGRDFRLHHGFNRIGRNLLADVQVMDDPAIADENHCSVVYDEKSNRFSVVPSSSGALTYYNGSLLTKAEILHMGDEISMGGSRFEFIPFCREGRIWEREDESSD